MTVEPLDEPATHVQSPAPTPVPAKESARDTVLVVCNYTPVPREGYRVGVPHGGYWREMLNSDAREYAGSGMGNLGGLQAEEIPTHGRPFSLKLTLPPLAALFFKAD